MKNQANQEIYQDRTGKPISDDVWQELRKNTEYCEVGRYWTDKIRITTMWIGLPGILFVSTILKVDTKELLDHRWENEEEARLAHDTLVVSVQSNIDCVITVNVLHIRHTKRKMN